ncbi:hypothetical protein JW960_13150, partial [candidate division KSB1 bacterium]|nr:hypothetical protein [candidate division KSB1 bacterium]
MKWIIGILLTIIVTASYARDRQQIQPDRIEFETIDDTQYKKIYMSDEKLEQKFGKGLDLAQYPGYYYQAVLPDIHKIIESYKNEITIDSVKIVDSLTAYIYIDKNNYVKKFGAESLDPDDGEFCGYHFIKIPKPAPYLPIDYGYPDASRELLNLRTPYSRSFQNDDNTVTAYLSMRPTSYANKTDGKIVWHDIQAWQPLSNTIMTLVNKNIRSFKKKVNQTNADINKYPSYYAWTVEVDNDLMTAYNYVWKNGSAATPEFNAVVGAGKDFDGIHYHNFNRVCFQFSTSGIPNNLPIIGVAFRTYIYNYDPENEDKSDQCFYDNNEISPMLKDMISKPEDEYNVYFPSSADYSSRNNNLFTETGEGINVYYPPQNNVWKRGAGETSYINFMSAGLTDFKSKYKTGNYIFALKDKSDLNDETNNDGKWQGIVIRPSLSILKVTYESPTYTLSITCNPSNAGTVSKYPDKTDFDENESVTITASPFSGYKFSYWGGAISSTGNPTTITMNGDKSVTAYFTQIEEEVETPNTPS